MSLAHTIEIMRGNAPPRPARIAELVRESIRQEREEREARANENWREVSERVGAPRDPSILGGFDFD